MFNLNVWDNDAEYLILDDIPFEFIGGGGMRKALWGSQKELTLSDKFLRKRSVKWNKPMIILCNGGEDYRFKTSGYEKEWYDGNSHVVEINEKLWI